MRDVVFEQTLEMLRMLAQQSSTARSWHQVLLWRAARCLPKDQWSLINPRLLAEGRLTAKAMVELLQSLATAAASGAGRCGGYRRAGPGKGRRLLADRPRVLTLTVPFTSAAVARFTILSSIWRTTTVRANPI